MLEIISDTSSCLQETSIQIFIQNFRLRELRTLNISKTKVTMNGLRTLFADCTFASSLEALNLSFCPGVEGKADLQSYN
ncbi:RNI-like protein [Gigaspora margarita]|uniref:RNI-like protein n=1 Tax=Gigaspora margarita TaxID=4874 RepID=A0A8H4EHW6_GIGMA|nr:RNI-like protein [Gigaspora margarita]